MCYSDTGKPTYVYRACWDEDGVWRDQQISNEYRQVAYRSSVGEAATAAASKDDEVDDSSEEEEEEEDTQSVSSDTIANPVSVSMDDEEAETADSDTETVGAADADGPEVTNQHETGETQSATTQSELKSTKKKLKRARKQLKQALKMYEAAQNNKTVRSAIQ